MRTLEEIVYAHNFMYSVWQRALREGHADAAHHSSKICEVLAWVIGEDGKFEDMLSNHKKREAERN
jgi:hypothetical protein